MNLTGSKFRVSAVAGAIFALVALAQSAIADSIYHLGPDTYGGGPIGTFLIPSVAQGVLFDLDAYDSPTEMTLMGLDNNFGEKVSCVAATRSMFVCSVEGVLQGHHGDDQHEWQANGQGLGGNDSLGHGPNDNDPLTQFVNSPVDDPAALVQTASIGDDPLLGLLTVPEPGSLILLVSALLIFLRHNRRLRRS
jgi:hypothetical protein